MFGFRERIVEQAGIRIRLGPHIVREIRKHFDQGSYEWSELNALQQKLDPEDVVMELGTGIGFLAAYCATHIGSERVFTYEANPELETHIKDTFYLNDVNPTLQMCLLGEKPGFQTFYVHTAFWESSTLADSKSVRAITVPVKSFNDELLRIQPTFLVIDIEGGEYELFRHMRFHTVRKIVLEIHLEKLGIEKVRFIRATLYRAGFRAVRELSNWDLLYLER